MNPQQVNKIIDYFADKTLSFGCEIQYKSVKGKILKREDDGLLFCFCDSGTGFLREHEIETLGHPVYKHHVEETLINSGKFTIGILNELTILWKACGLSKSLQQIAEKSGYEKGYLTKELEFRESDCTGDIERLKDTKARDLFNFLAQFINDKNQ